MKKYEFQKFKKDFHETRAQDSDKDNFEKMSNNTNNCLFRLTEEQFKNNILIIKDINEKINDCKTLNLSELNQCIIDIYSLLMQIPYKYGRVNLERCSTGLTNINQCITNIGFPYLVKCLKENKKIKNYDKIREEIISIFPRMLNQFLFYQYQEEHLNQMGELISLPQKLLQDIQKYKYEIEKINALKYTPAEKDTLLKEIGGINSEISSLESAISQLQREMKSPADIQTEINAINNVINILEKEIDEFRNKTKSLKDELEQLNLEKIDPSDSKKENERRYKIEELNRKVIAIPSEINKRELKIKSHSLEKNNLEKVLTEIKTSKPFLEEKYEKNDSKVKEISGNLLKLNEKKSTLENTNVAKDKFAEHKKNIREINNEIGSLDEKVSKLKKENIVLGLRIQYADLTQEEKGNQFIELQIKLISLQKSLEEKKELRRIAGQKDSTGVRKELADAKNEKNELCSELKRLKKEEAELQLKKDSLEKSIANEYSITDIKNIFNDLQNAKSDGNKFTKLHPPPKNEGSVDLHAPEREQIGQKIENAKSKAKPFINNPTWQELDKELFNVQTKINTCNRNISPIDSKIKKLEKGIDGYKKFEMQREELFEKLPKMEKEMEIMTQQLGVISQKGSNEPYEFKELMAFQNEYDLNNIEEMISNFRQALLFADTNITIVLAIVDFVSWHKEYCGEEMAQRIENIISTKLIKDLRGFRNRAMHGLDSTGNLNTMTNSDTRQSLDGLKDLVLAMFDCLLDKNNQDYLGCQEEEFKLFFSTSSCIDKIEGCLPELKFFLDDKGNQRKLICSEQLDFITSSVLNSKAIIQVINHSINEDKEQFSLEKITDIMSKPNNQLDEHELKIKLKYDGLLQSLGQAIGNLQQYTEVDLTGVIPISLEDIKTKFSLLNELVPQIKDYRSSRAHSGYYNEELFTAVLTNIANFSKAIDNQLDGYLEMVKKDLMSEPILEVENFDNMVTCYIQ